MQIGELYNRENLFTKRHQEDDMASPKSASPAQVLTFFDNGKMDPIKFRYNGRVYPVKRVHREWTESRAQGEHRHYLIESNDAANYELRFDSRRNTWQVLAHS